MRNTERWKLTAETDKICLWVDDVLPLSTAHATVGELFGDVVEFTSLTLAVSASARIVSAIPDSNGTTFDLSVS